MNDDQPPASASLPIAAWAVHLLSASGAVLALLALLAIDGHRWTEAMLWLLAALAVDGIDGTLARAARVIQRAPRIDGEALDLVIDYLTYVVIPAMIIWRAAVLPEAWGLPLAAAILVSSLYVFARRDMKTEDGYFRGFPALWNVVALYFVAAPPAPVPAALIVGTLVVLTFAPVHVPHPFRTRDFQPMLPAAAILWAASSALLLVPLLDEGLRTAALAASLSSTAVIAGAGLLRSFRGPR